MSQEPGKSDNDEEDIVGRCYRIKFCKNALKTFQKALGSVEHRKQKKLVAQTEAQLKRLANGTLLNTDSDVAEGRLPDGANFRALKRIPIRCYYWKSTSMDGVIYVSHFIYKDQNKLDKRDTEKVCNNWRVYEQGDL
jgi:hypothetical protein